MADTAQDTVNKDFTETVMYMAKVAGPFEPSATYYPKVDFIEVLAKDDSFYASRINDTFTVYISHDTGEVVGCLLHGVKTIVAEGVEE